MAHNNAAGSLAVVSIHNRSSHASHWFIEPLPADQITVESGETLTIQATTLEGPVTVDLHVSDDGVTVWVGTATRAAVPTRVALGADVVFEDSGGLPPFPDWPDGAARG